VQITRENIDALNAIVKVDIAVSDYMPKVEDAIRQYRKNVALKGFRKGQVPPSLIKKMYGTSILLDEINKLVGEETEKYFKENQVDMLGRPLPKNTITELDINNPVDYSLEFEIGLSPEFSIPAIESKATVTESVILVDDATAEKELDSMRTRYGIITEVEDGVAEGDVIYVKLEELDGDAVKEGGVVSTTPVSTDLFKKDPKFHQSLFGKQKSDSLDVNLFDVIDRERDAVIKHVLELKDGAPEGMGDRFRLTIEKVNRSQKAALTQEFFDKIFGPGKVSNEEEALTKLKEELSAYFSKSADEKLKSDIVELLISGSNISLPDDFLKRWIRSSNEKPITDEDLEQEYPAFARNLRWSLISNKIGRDNDLQADMEDIKAFSREEMRKQLAMYNPGGQAVEDEYLEMLNNSMLSKEDHVKKSYEGAMEQKLFTFIKSQLNVEQKTVSLDEFLER
jgi:trigger factor